MKTNQKVYEGDRVAILGVHEDGLGNHAQEALRESLKAAVRTELKVSPLALGGKDVFVVPDGAAYEEGTLVMQDGTEWLLAAGPVSLAFAQAMAKEYGDPIFLHAGTRYEIDEHGNVECINPPTEVLFGERAKEHETRIEFPDGSALSYLYESSEPEPVFQSFTHTSGLLTRDADHGPAYAQNGSA